MGSFLSTATDKVVTRFRRDGPAKALRYYVGAAKHGAHYLAYDRSWDRLDRRRTSGARYVTDRDGLAGAPRQHEERLYQAMPRAVLLWALGALRLDAKGFTFIDYGSGRGRVLLTAARLPFERVIGIEFAETLHAEAAENIAAFPKDRLACTDVVSLHQNAVEFEPPAGDIVAFFYNPFTGATLDAVAARIEASWRASPRTIHVIFANSNRAPLFVDRPIFRPVRPPGSERLLLRLLAPVPIQFFELGGARPAG